MDLFTGMLVVTFLAGVLVGICIVALSAVVFATVYGFQPDHVEGVDDGA